MKYIWWILIILWSIPETLNMVMTKKCSEIGEFLFKKVGL
jgi:hypothetical protein